MAKYGNKETEPLKKCPVHFSVGHILLPCLGHVLKWSSLSLGLWEWRTKGEGSTYSHMCEREPGLPMIKDHAVMINSRLTIDPS